MNKLSEMLKIADIHAGRIKNAIAGLKNIFPISAKQAGQLPEDVFLLTELLTGRFAKLQDLMGAKLIDAFLEDQDETTANMTMIDKVNKLEKMGIIESAELWREMRQVRNNIAHEYPDHPELTADNLNQIFALAPKLLELLENIKGKDE
jgi:uncharacterized protein YutE (UPF0331/DUF86 family)